MQIPRINIEKSDLITLFRIYRRTIAYCLIAIVAYSIIDKAANNFATKPVVVASKDIAAGTYLTSLDLKETRIPISAISKNVVSFAASKTVAPSTTSEAIVSGSAATVVPLTTSKTSATVISGTFPTNICPTDPLSSTVG